MNSIAAIVEIIVVAGLLCFTVWLSVKYAIAKEKLDEEYQQWRLDKIANQTATAPDPDRSFQRFLDEREIKRRVK